MTLLQLPSGLELSLPVLLLLAGTGLIVAEALAPGAHFIVVGIALLAAGLVGLVVGGGALGIFLMMLSVLLVGGLAFYAYREFDLYGGKGRSRTSDSSSLRGKTGQVTERVTTAGGQVKLDGGGFNPYYAARSMEGEIPEGTEVMVIDPGGGNVVVVEPLSLIEDAIDRELREGRAHETDRDEPETV
ncbi:NfeD family protein [Halomarina pelagica]|uniref:NfeD family protein n=1 Tax=Halomarina pelagica TaxID=2961599 RepID=UPI0020C43FA3|nr:NfeD family protein [Halomarina sp. BND7]